MRICIVLPCNIYTAPFYKRYINIFKSIEAEFDLIYWDRADILEETFADNTFKFEMPDEVNSGNSSKIFKYLKFNLFVKNILEKRKYDRVLILGSYAGIMAQLSSFLSSKYSGKYWLDIRDYTFEKNRLYLRMMTKAIKSSHATVISSPGYKEFLPEWDYIQAHNIDFDSINSFNPSNKIKDDKIRISFIGLVRYYEQNKKLLEIFKNNSQFTLQYFGMNSEILEEYCQANEIHNVEFHGRFKPSETPYFYNKTDVVNNIYGSTGIELTTALSNKLYYAASAGIPILVSKDTLMADISCKYGFGYAVDLSDMHLPKKLERWYLQLNQSKMFENCRLFMKSVEEDEIEFETRLINFISD